MPEILPGNVCTGRQQARRPLPPSEADTVVFFGHRRPNVDVAQGEPSISNPTDLVPYPFTGLSADARVEEMRHSLWKAYPVEYAFDVTPFLFSKNSRKPF